MAFALSSVGQIELARSLYGYSPLDIRFGTLAVNAAQECGSFALEGQWGAVANGRVDLAGPVAITYAGAGTISEASLRSSPLAGDQEIATLSVVGAAGSGADAIVSSTTSGVGVSLTNFTLYIPVTFGTTKLNTTLRNAILSTFVSGPTGYGEPIELFHDTNPALVYFYTGSAPADPDASPTGTLLATGSLLQSDFTFPNALPLSLAAPVTVNGSANGTAGYARIVAANGCAMRCSVGSGSGDIDLSTITIANGVPFDINAIDISVA